VAARDRTTARIIAALAIAAAALTLYQLTRPGLLFGVTPDVSVYLGGAVRLVHGAVPYRDFVFIQPPGFVVLSAPFAYLSELIGTRDTLAVLRLCTPLLAAANVVLAGRVVRHCGRAAAVATCAVMAVFPAELYAIRGPQLEPLLVLFCLAGAALVFDSGELAGPRRLALGGLALGFAVAIKAPAALPVAVLIALCVPRARRRLLPMLAGLAAGFLVPTVPFIALAPGAFMRDVAGTLFGRIPGAGRVGWLVRLTDLTGASVLGGSPALAVALAVAVGALLVAAFAVHRRPTTALDLFALGSVLLVALAQLAPALYYAQYAAFITPFLAVLIGISVSRVAPARARALAPAAAAVALLALSVAEVGQIASESVPDLARQVDAVVPAGGCALSDSPVYLFTADRFQSSARGCTGMTDPYGTTLVLGTTSADAVATWRAAFAHVDYVVTSSAVTEWTLPAAAHLVDYVAANFVLRRTGPLLVYVRDGQPARHRPVGVTPAHPAAA
jgi:hypothetical protein